MSAHACVCAGVHTWACVHQEKSTGYPLLPHPTPCSFEAESVSVSLSLGNQHVTTSHYSLFIYSWGNTLVFLLCLAHLKVPPCIGIYGTSSLFPRC